MAEDGLPTTVSVLGNDTDVDGDGLSVTAVTQPTNGSVTFTAADVTYTPNADFNGADPLHYTIGDGNGGSATATVNMTVTPRTTIRWRMMIRRRRRKTRRSRLVT